MTITVIEKYYGGGGLENTTLCTHTYTYICICLYASRV